MNKGPREPAYSAPQAAPPSYSEAVGGVPAAAPYAPQNTGTHTHTTIIQFVRLIRIRIILLTYLTCTCTVYLSFTPVFLILFNCSFHWTQNSDDHNSIGSPFGSHGLPSVSQWNWNCYTSDSRSNCIHFECRDCLCGMFLGMLSSALLLWWLYGCSSHLP